MIIAVASHADQGDGRIFSINETDLVSKWIPSDTKEVLRSELIEIMSSVICWLSKSDRLSFNRIGNGNISVTVTLPGETRESQFVATLQEVLLLERVAG